MFDMLCCVIQLIVVIWDETHKISEVCLYLNLPKKFLSSIFMITREDVLLTEHRLTEPSKVKLNFGAPVAKMEDSRITILEACIFWGA